MLGDLKVKVGPQYYHYAEGAIAEVSDLLENYEAKKVLIVHGVKSWEKAEPYLTFLKNPNITFYFHKYTGECSYYGIDLILDIVKNKSIDFIIGVGGGKLTDLVGLASNKAKRRFGVIPTLASNCAPWTPLSVMYKENGESEGQTVYFYEQAAFFITDPKLIVDSPVDYFIAGIADTLAKWYESDEMTSQPELQQELYVQLARHIAFESKKCLMTNGHKAIEDMKNGIVSQEFYTCSEIIFSMAGLVGGFGDRFARNAAAHALHDGIGMYLPKSHTYLHGVKVAYGILFQLALEEKWSEIRSLLPYYVSLNLPKSLTEMGLYPIDDKTLSAIFDFVAEQDKVKMLPYNTDKERLVATLKRLEEFLS